jgi:hypothetical protein
MNTYKLIFDNNEVVSCDLVYNVILAEDYYFHHTNGKLIHALVRAESEDEALSKRSQIVSDFREHVFGKDFIS